MKKSKSNINVSVVIPSFNAKKLLEKNLPKVLKASQYKRNRIKEIIVVDDGSTDGSGDFVKENFAKVRVIKHKVNRGFSAAVNMGVKMAKGELVALINNDVIVDIDFLAQVIRHFREVKVFAVSMHEEGYGWAKGEFKDGYIVHSPGEENDRAHRTFWVSGGSGVFRRSYWMKLGGMDEKLLSPFYWEDLDLCYRAAKRGYALRWEPKSKVIHKHESTISKFPEKYVRRIKERNQLIFVWKNLTSPNLFKRHLRGLLRRMALHPGYIRVVLSALTKYRAIRRARRKEKKETTVSDEAIFASF